jgi:hypothetical protein
VGPEQETIASLTILALAARQGRILVTHDVSTMPPAFARFRQTRDSPGVVLTPQDQPMREAIENLLILWEASDAAEWKNRICYLPTFADFQT